MRKNAQQSSVARTDAAGARPGFCAFYGSIYAGQWRIQQTSMQREDRYDTNRDALAMLRDFPLTGIGAGSFYAVFPMYTTPSPSPALRGMQKTITCSSPASSGWFSRPCWRRRAGVALDGHSRPTQAPRPAIARHGLRGHDGHRGAADSFGGRLQSGVFMPGPSRRTSPGPHWYLNRPESQGTAVAGGCVATVNHSELLRC
jgi:hypothetical protein